jgi:hypothetical protein
VFPVNPVQASRYRERHGLSGAKSDQGDAHMLADMVRTDSLQLRPAAGDTAQAPGIKVVACTYETLSWQRTQAVQRLRHQLRENFPAALDAVDDLDAPDVLELLARASERAQAFAALNASPGARAFHDGLRARGIRYNDALRRPVNKLVGILHGCLKTRTLYAWEHRENLPQPSLAA